MLEKIYLKKSNSIFWLFWFCFYPPPIIEAVFPTSEYAFQVLKIICLCISLSIAVCKEELLKISWYEVSIVVFGVYGILNNILNKYSYSFMFIKGVFFPLAAVAFIVQILSCYDRKRLIDIFINYFILLIWINTVTMLVYPNGIIRSDMGASIVRAYWFLGSKNVIVQELSLYLLAIGLAMKQTGKKYIGWLTLFVALISFSSMGNRGTNLLKGSTTAIIMLFMFMLLYFLGDLIKNHLISFFSMFTIAVATILISFFLYIVAQGKVHIVNVILELCGKNYTFSYRNTVWKALYYTASKNILFGIGTIRVRFPLGSSYAETCYSFWGANWLQYGIIGIILIVFIFLFSETKAIHLKLDDEKLLIQFSLLFLLIGGFMNELDWKNIAVLLTLRRYACELMDNFIDQDIRNA